MFTLFVVVHGGAKRAMLQSDLRVPFFTAIFFVFGKKIS